MTDFEGEHCGRIVDLVGRHSSFREAWPACQEVTVRSPPAVDEDQGVSF